MIKIKNDLVKIEDTYELNYRDILNEILETEIKIVNIYKEFLNKFMSVSLEDDE